MNFIIPGLKISKSLRIRRNSKRPTILVILFVPPYPCSDPFASIVCAGAAFTRDRFSRDCFSRLTSLSGTWCLFPIGLWLVFDGGTPSGSEGGRRDWGIYSSQSHNSASSLHGSRVAMSPLAPVSIRRDPKTPEFIY